MEEMTEYFSTHNILNTPQINTTLDQPAKDACEFNQNFNVSFCTLKNARPYQEDRFQCGIAPSNFFLMDQSKRNHLLKISTRMLQDEITAEIEDEMWNRGSTVMIVTAKLSSEEIHIDLAHLGDSMTFLIIQDSGKNLIRFERLNQALHHPNEPEERTRILQAGGKLIKDDHILTVFDPKWPPPKNWAQLALSRALGNNRFNHNNSEVISREAAYIYKRELLPPGCTARVLIASDGLMEPFTDPINCKGISPDQCIADLYKQCLHLSLQDIPIELGKLIKAKGSSDNLTICLTELNASHPALFFSLFDGHGGYEVAELAKRKITAVLNKAYKKVLVDDLSVSRPQTDSDEQFLNSTQSIEDDDDLEEKPMVFRSLSFLDEGKRKYSDREDDTMKRTKSEPLLRL